MTTPAPRCITCHTVVSPHWTHCQVCRRAIPTQPDAVALQHCRIQPGYDVVYWDEQKEATQNGRVTHVAVEQGRLLIMLESGRRIQERHLRAVTVRTTDGTPTAAFTTRHEDLRMIDAPVSTPPEPAPAKALRSQAYLHWKTIADATMGIYPHERRYATIVTMLDKCETFFTAGDEPGFLRSKQQLLNFIAASTPRQKVVPPGQTA